MRKRYFGAGGHHEPHFPVFYDNLGKGMLIACFLWIFYRAKENKGQLFGFNLPWLEGHEHEHHHFVQQGLGDAMPQLAEEENHDDEESDESD
eukprot:CAMPEP_0182420850 /NCGR_PEP_ID=MMETSP1167-20130531/5935_1 /TAXON_ID=2988 /ORGANISM="Mallomonas Sp, Strain CCMP3275" /LENGTH=91 /DNA_ID=CAMNT_0024597353 /DNA_START=148 /DNA_END=423 /DNA_ORIENTATION=+